MDSMIKVMVVEDDPLWRECICEHVGRESDIKLISAVSTKEKAMEVASQVELDVVLIDIMLTENNLDGIDLAMELSSHYDAKLIMLTNITEDEVIVDAFTAGAVDYIPKIEYKNLAVAIRCACLNHPHIPSSVAQVLRNEVVTLKKQERSRLLTTTEKEILKEIQQGHTIKRIAETSFKTEQTIKNQITRILKKLGTRSSREAARKAKRMDLID